VLTAAVQPQTVHAVLLAFSGYRLDQRRNPDVEAFMR